MITGDGGHAFWLVVNGWSTAIVSGLWRTVLDEGGRQLAVATPPHRRAPPGSVGEGSEVDDV